jgi:hypothetical protein
MWNVNEVELDRPKAKLLDGALVVSAPLHNVKSQCFKYCKLQQEGDFDVLLKDGFIEI